MTDVTVASGFHVSHPGSHISLPPLHFWYVFYRVDVEAYVKPLGTICVHKAEQRTACI